MIKHTRLVLKHNIGVLWVQQGAVLYLDITIHMAQLGSV